MQSNTTDCPRSNVTDVQEVSYHSSGIRQTYMIQHEQTDDLVTLEMVQGQLQIKDRAQEYIDRGDLLENWLYLDFFLGTYDGPPLKDCQSHRGRTPNTRVPYREGSNLQGCCHIIRSPGHKTMPYFLGQWFPKREEENSNGLFEASMLALLKPWRKITDLKQEIQSFREALDMFVTNAPAETCWIIRNVQFFHECSDSVRRCTMAPESNIDTS